MKVRIVVTIAGILLASSAWAQEPPSWVNLGNVPAANSVRDILELPAYNTILVCGNEYFHDNVYQWRSRIWKSVDSGQSWSQKHVCGGGSNFTEYYAALLYDEGAGMIWGVRTDGGDLTRQLCYSANVGESWTNLDGPGTNPAITGQTIETIGDYLYFGGSVSSPYSISLYRLQTDSLVWELVTQYPECNAITKLKVHDGNLLVFAKDKDENVIRVFSYTPTSLDAKATPVGKAEVTPPEPGR